MNASSHQQAVELLAEVLALAPEIRLGQLFAHVGFLGEVHYERGLGDLEDDECVEVLRRHRDELLRRLESARV